MRGAKNSALMRSFTFLERAKSMNRLANPCGSDFVTKLRGRDSGKLPFLTFSTEGVTPDIGNNFIGAP